MSRAPKMVNLHYEQMYNTLKLLESSKFASLTIPPKLIDKKNKEFMISWDNQNRNEGVNASNFLFMDAYERVLNNRSFQALLFDNSILRCSLEFKDDVIVRQNFSWIPCPLITEHTFEDSFAVEPAFISERILERNFYKEDILLRSTVRYDYDFKSDKPEYLLSHMHLQNPETRISINEPVCFNSFVKNIIENYYPQSYYIKKKIVPREVFEDLQLSKWEGLNFKTSGRKKKIGYKNQLNKNCYFFERLTMG